MTLKIAVLAPIPSPSVRIARSAKPRFLKSVRKPKRTSCSNWSMVSSISARATGGRRQRITVPLFPSAPSALFSSLVGDRQEQAPYHGRPADFPEETVRARRQSDRLRETTVRFRTASRDYSRFQNPRRSETVLPWPLENDRQRAPRRRPLERGFPTLPAEPRQLGSRIAIGLESDPLILPGLPGVSGVEDRRRRNRDARRAGDLHIHRHAVGNLLEADRHGLTGAAILHPDLCLRRLARIRLRRSGRSSEQRGRQKQAREYCSHR